MARVFALSDRPASSSRRQCYSEIIRRAAPPMARRGVQALGGTDIRVSSIRQTGEALDRAGDCDTARRGDAALIKPSAVRNYHGSRGRAVAAGGASPHGATSERRSPIAPIRAKFRAAAPAAQTLQGTMPDAAVYLGRNTRCDAAFTHACREEKVACGPQLAASGRARREPGRGPSGAPRRGPRECAEATTGRSRGQRG